MTDEQKKNVKEFAEKNKPFVVLRYQICHSSLMLNPLQIMGKAKEDKIKEDGRIFYCPSPCCIGYVEFEIDDNIYNCAECGYIWKCKNDVFNSISEIIKKYPHRKEVYKKFKDGWKSIPNKYSF